MGGEYEPWNLEGNTVIVKTENLSGCKVHLLQYLDLISFGRGHQKKRGEERDAGVGGFC